ncbi:MAG: outer membrane protein assembly factor BamE [Pseudomonadota bacterium]
MSDHHIATNRGRTGRRSAVLTMLCLVCLTAGCSFPRLYRATIQQGNVITQEMIDQLKPGMSTSQVAFVMGEPVLKNPFMADRWVYLYRVEVPGRYEEERRLTLYFEDGLLAYFAGDYLPTTAMPGAPAPADDALPSDPAAAADTAQGGR